MSAGYDIVIPTVGRPSLAILLESLAASRGPLPERAIVVDDRRERSSALWLGSLGTFAERVRVVTGAGSGPAAARNRGWRMGREEWVAFLDDDVIVEPDWRARLHEDLLACGERDAGSQGSVRVPLPPGRRPTDWERNVRALEGAQWITADCAYRRSALEAIDGFDERFTRAYREDADLALRLIARGASIVRGRRRIEHPVRPADRWISVRLQGGNADDALMRALHGPNWHARAGARPGAFGAHVFAVACTAGALVCGTAWLAATLRFAWLRIAPGPRSGREIATMLATSAAIPFAAVYYRLRGYVRLRQTLQRTRRLPAAVLFDRDGTLVHDDPALRDPTRVRPIAGVARALQRLRDAGIALGVVTNQHRIGEGDLSREELRALHARIEELLGPFAVWSVCAHARGADCSCRKPQPGLVRAAAARIGVAPSACVVVGDVGTDIAAASNAGARAILVPTVATRGEEIAEAANVAPTLARAVDRILAGTL